MRNVIENVYVHHFPVPPPPPEVGMVLIFQDEAQSVYNPNGTGAWDADVAEWDDKG